jgi:formylmethanofuran dehydrogenase subunit A
MGATDSFSIASLDVYTDLQETLEDLFVAPMQLWDSCNTLGKGGFREICKNSKAIYKKKGLICIFFSFF